jgi:hypothetical protein
MIDFIQVEDYEQGKIPKKSEGKCILSHEIGSIGDFHFQEGRATVRVSRIGQ